MWPPNCMGRHLAHIRDTSQGAPEGCLGPLPSTAELPLLAAPRELLCPWNSLCGAEGLKCQPRIVPCGHFIPWVPFTLPQQVWVELHSPVESRTLSFLHEASWLSWEPVCWAEQCWTAKNFQHYWKPLTCHSFAQGPPPLPFPLVPCQRGCGNSALPSRAPFPRQVPDTLSTQEGVPASPRV